MVKVLMINYEYPPLGGGTAVANQGLVAEFRKFKNLQINILTSSPDKYQEKSGIIRLDIGKHNRNLHHQSYFDLWYFLVKSTIWTLKYRHNYDLIHAYSGLPGAITAYLSGLPFIVSLGGADEPGYEPRHRWLWLFLKPFMGYIYRRARSLDANSRYLKNLVLKSWPDLKIKIISNGVDTHKFYPAKKPVKQNIILSTSRFGERKGIEYLIRAMTFLPNKTRLWLAGSGLLEPKLKQLVKKLRLSSRIKFLGIIPHKHLPELYRKAKIFVLPSLSESRSNSLLEALASGLPVVATNIGGNPELINKNNGLLVPPADVIKLAQAINQALNKPWPKIALNSKYLQSSTAKKYFQLYQSRFN